MTTQEWIQLQKDITDALLLQRDKELRYLTDRVITLENRVGQLKPGEKPVDYTLVFKEINARLDDHGSKVNSALSRLDILETARKEQRLLNGATDNKLKELESDAVEESKSEVKTEFKLDVNKLFSWIFKK